VTCMWTGVRGWLSQLINLYRKAVMFHPGSADVGMSQSQIMTLLANYIIRLTELEDVS
jgi:hypothetical protein